MTWILNGIETLVALSGLLLFSILLALFVIELFSIVLGNNDNTKPPKKAKTSFRKKLRRLLNYSVKVVTLNNRKNKFSYHNKEPPVFYYYNRITDNNCKHIHIVNSIIIIQAIKNLFNGNINNKEFPVVRNDVVFPTVIYNNYNTRGP